MSCHYIVYDYLGVRLKVARRALDFPGDCGLNVVPSVLVRPRGVCRGLLGPTALDAFAAAIRFATSARWDRTRSR